MANVKCITLLFLVLLAVHVGVSAAARTRNDFGGDGDGGNGGDGDDSSSGSGSDGDSDGGSDVDSGGGDDGDGDGSSGGDGDGSSGDDGDSGSGGDGGGGGDDDDKDYEKDFGDPDAQMLGVGFSLDTRLNFFNRSAFPRNFTFGTGSSAYQFEGAADIKAQSIWDNFTAAHPERIKDGSNGSVAVDTYNRYEEDIKLMKGLGFDSYRFSISWSRLLPGGRIDKGLNYEGVRYYNSVIQEIIVNDMKPFATLFHFDLPQALEDEYGGFLNEAIVNDFRDYADLCFSLFGDRVKHWFTINEPWSYSTLGYGYGLFPPNRCSKRKKTLQGSREFIDFGIGRFFQESKSITCAEGDSSTEPYIVSHNMLLSHATAVQLYRNKYQKHQNGQIGITICTEWATPQNPSSNADWDAAKRSMAFVYGWFMEPLRSGEYPAEMIENVRERLPTFSPSESDMVKGSFDYIGLNYYTAHYAQDVPCSANRTYMSDPCVRVSKSKGGKPIGQTTDSDWIYVVPSGLRDTLLHSKNYYDNPLIYVTENGMSRRDHHQFRPHDVVRTRYHHNHLVRVYVARVHDKVNVAGYFAWSMLDNFEWLDGYTQRFGLVYVDYNQNLKRICKDSAYWFRRFLLKPNVTIIS